MMEEKQFTEVFPNIIESSCSFKDNGVGITHKEVCSLLNKLYDENKELKKEKEELQSKTKVLLDFYSKRYADAIFNNQRHSKTLREELWIVKEILCELGLYEDE